MFTLAAEQFLKIIASKLIRQYIPKNASFDQHNEQHIRPVQKKINARPREKLNFDSPTERFYSFVE